MRYYTSSKKEKTTLMTVLVCTLVWSVCSCEATRFEWNKNTGNWSGQNWTGSTSSPTSNTSNLLEFGVRSEAGYTSTHDLGDAFQLNALQLIGNFTGIANRTWTINSADKDNNGTADAIQFERHNNKPPEIRLQATDPPGGSRGDFVVDLNIILNDNLTINGDQQNPMGGIFTGNITEIGGARSVRKEGNSTFIYKGNASYTGTTRVAEGFLSLAGATLGTAQKRTSDLHVEHGAAILGNGVIFTSGALLGKDRIGGKVELNPRRPDEVFTDQSSSGIGTLTLDSLNGVQLESGSMFKTTISGLDSFGQLKVVGGGVDILSGAELSVNLDFGAGYVPVLGDSFLVLDNAGIAPIGGQGQFQSLAEGAIVPTLGDTSSLPLAISYVGDDVVLSFVPEPSARLSIVLGLVCLCCYRYNRSGAKKIATS